MTKARPLFENALLKVLGDLTPERCSAVTNREASYLREASDPDRPQLLTVRDMIALDVEHIARDGKAPLFAAVGAMLAQARAAIYQDAVAISDATRDVLKEDSDAHLALFAACQPGASDQVLIAALRETKEAVAAQTQAIEVVQVALQHRGKLPP